MFIRLNRVGYRKNPTKYNHESMICAVNRDYHFLVDIKNNTQRARLYIRKGIASPRTAWYQKQKQKQNQNQML